MSLKLKVPYNEKEEAKSKGAFWDTVTKTWYVPRHKKYNDFIKWIDIEEPCIIAKIPFYVALNNRDCWKCSETTNVISLASNDFYEFDYVNEDDEDDQTKEWLKQDYYTFFSSPIYIEKDIIKLIQEKFPFYKLGYSKTVKGKYWANHCQHCNALQGDFFNHDEPGGAFSPMSIEDCKEITLIKVPSKFDLIINAGTGWSSIEDMILKYSGKKEW